MYCLLPLTTFRALSAKWIWQVLKTEKWIIIDG